MGKLVFSGEKFKADLIRIGFEESSLEENNPIIDGLFEGVEAIPDPDLGGGWYTCTAGDITYPVHRDWLREEDNE